MNLLKKTCLTLTPFLLSAVLMTPAAADTTTAENTGKGTPEDVVLRTDSDFIGSWNVTVKKGQIESLEKFSLLPGGILLHSGPPIVIYPYNLRFNTSHGAWVRDDKGNVIIRYNRSLFWAADGAYFDDEEVTGILSLDKDNNLIGELTIGMINDEVASPSGIKVTFSGTKINAIQPGATTQ